MNETLLYPLSPNVFSVGRREEEAQNDPIWEIVTGSGGMDPSLRPPLKLVPGYELAVRLDYHIPAEVSETQELLLGRVLTRSTAQQVQKNFPSQLFQGLSSMTDITLSRRQGIISFDRFPITSEGAYLAYENLGNNPAKLFYPRWSEEHLGEIVFEEKLTRSGVREPIPPGTIISLPGLRPVFLCCYLPNALDQPNWWRFRFSYPEPGTDLRKIAQVREDKTDHPALQIALTPEQWLEYFSLYPQKISKQLRVDYENGSPYLNQDLFKAMEKLVKLETKIKSLKTVFNPVVEKITIAYS